MNEAQVLIQHTYDAANFAFFAFALITAGTLLYGFGALAIGIYKAVKEENASRREAKQRTFTRKVQYARY